jgi:Transposase DDE domain
MEHQLWKSIVTVLASLDKRRKSTAYDFSDEDIVRIYFWAVIHDRPVMWACCHRNWPIHLRKQRLPSCSTMSRRLRSPSVVALLEALDRHVHRVEKPGWFWIIDGKPLPIGGCSKDPDARYGRAAGCKAVGYKIHALVNPAGLVVAWQLHPMNVDERVVAEQLLKSADVSGYVVADSNYDSNKLHRVCDEHGDLQLVTERRYGPGHDTGHRRQAPGRLRSIAITESPYPAFGRQLLLDRRAIERLYGHLTNWGGALTCLPPWVRRLSRVRPWVQAKFVLAAQKRRLTITTYAA